MILLFNTIYCNSIVIDLSLFRVIGCFIRLLILRVHEINRDIYKLIHTFTVIKKTQYIAKKMLLIYFYTSC